MNLMDASTQWRNRPSDERFETVETLRDAVHQRRLHCRSTDLLTSKIQAKVMDDGGLTINSSIAPARPSHWAFGQLAASVKAPANYLRSLPTELAVRNLNYGLEAEGRDINKFLTIDNDNGTILQAVTSPSYGRIWDADVVDTVIRMNERTGNKFYNPKAINLAGGGTKPSGLYASDHDIFMFMIDGGSMLDAGPRAQLNRGFLVWNSETGAKTFGLMTFLFNVVCQNHIIWGAQDINKVIIRHTANGPYRFDAQAAPALRAYCESSEKPVLDTIHKAQEFLLPASSGSKVSLDDAISFATKHGKFTRAEVASAVNFAKSEEGECRTLWHLVQGFTAYARGFDYIDARVDLEKRAGRLLDLAA